MKTLTGGIFDRPPHFLAVSSSDPEQNGLDIAVVRVLIHDRISDLTRFEFAVGDESVRVGQAVRVVVLDIYTPEGRRDWVADHRVVDGIVSSIDEPGIEFSITADLWGGHSGSVVLDEDMRVIGMVKRTLDIRNPGGRIEGRVARAVHVDAIRGKLCEWGYLTGAACR